MTLAAASDFRASPPRIGKAPPGNCIVCFCFCLSKRTKIGKACHQPDLKFGRGAVERNSASAVSPAIAFDPIVTKGLAAPGM